MQFRSWQEGKTLNCVFGIKPVICIVKSDRWCFRYDYVLDSTLMADAEVSGGA